MILQRTLIEHAFTELKIGILVPLQYQEIPSVSSTPGQCLINLRCSVDWLHHHIVLRVKAFGYTTMTLYVLIYVSRILSGILYT
jgi:hypothetical protein